MKKTYHSPVLNKTVTREASNSKPGLSNVGSQFAGGFSRGTGFGGIKAIQTSYKKLEVIQVGV
jgi:hypothetical protein